MTTIAPSAKTIDQITAHYVSSSEDVELRKMKIRDAVMADIASVFVAYPDISTMEIVGYTPGFNDGDPCTHGQNDVRLNGAEEYEARARRKISENSIPSVKTYAEVGAIVSGMADDLNRAFDTNWKLKIHRNGDAIEYDQEDYDCGY